MSYLSQSDYDNLQRQDEEDLSEQCMADYSSTGMCPCCGVELVTDTMFDEMSGLYAHIQSCESCGWESVPLYE